MLAAGQIEDEDVNVSFSYILVTYVEKRKEAEGL
jgi:hypothetical protein